MAKNVILSYAAHTRRTNPLAWTSLLFGIAAFLMLWAGPLLRRLYYWTPGDWRILVEVLALLPCVVSFICAGITIFTLPREESPRSASALMAVFGGVLSFFGFMGNPIFDDPSA